MHLPVHLRRLDPRSLAGKALAEALRRGSDRQIELALGNRAVMGLLMLLARRRIVPGTAGGFEGTIGCELTRTDGSVDTYALVVDAERAHIHRGIAVDPQLTVRLGHADLVRLAAGQLSFRRAVMAGRLSVSGNVTAVPRLVRMLGRSGGRLR